MLASGKGWLDGERRLNGNGGSPDSQRQNKNRLSASGALRLETALFGLALAVYLLTRLIALPAFPIYFFTDEAVQTVLAADLVRDGFHGYDHQFLPTYFLNSYQYNLSASVYLQVIPYLLFGKSIWVTRGVAALATLIAAVCVGLTLKHVFHSPYPWVAPLMLSITPAWFLHSRTAFETSLAVSFYAGFLYFYLRYRSASPGYLYPAVVLAALTFYSYSPARMVVVLTAGLLFFSDLGYHWQQRRFGLRALGLVLLLALPLARFQVTHPEENLRHLQVLNSYWIRPIPLSEKLDEFIGEYLRGLSPLYWYLPNTVDLPRHRMKGYAHLLQAALPLAFLGLGLALRRIRQSPYRALLLAALAAPSGAALVALGITRALVMVIPASLLAALGCSALLQWLSRRWRGGQILLPVALFLALAGFNFWMLGDALINGPRWFDDYGLGGMQYGARQIYPAIDDYLEQNPGVQLILSPSWANGADTLTRFFYDDPPPFSMGSIDGYFNQKLPLGDNTVFVMIPEELERVTQSGKFTDVRIEGAVPYPNGQPGFFFVRLRYVDNIDEILAQEQAERRVLQVSEQRVGDAPARVSYPYLDMGEIKHIFDGDPNTLVRTMEANPLQVRIDYVRPQLLSGLQVRIGGVPTEVAVQLQDENGNVLLGIAHYAAESPNPRTLEIDFGRALAARRILIDITSVYEREPAHVHLWEVTPLAADR